MPPIRRWVRDDRPQLACPGQPRSGSLGYQSSNVLVAACGPLPQVVVGASWMPLDERSDRELARPAGRERGEERKRPIRVVDAGACDEATARQDDPPSEGLGLERVVDARAISCSSPSAAPHVSTSSQVPSSARTSSARNSAGQSRFASATASARTASNCSTSFSATFAFHTCTYSVISRRDFGSAPGMANGGHRHAESRCCRTGSDLLLRWWRFLPAAEIISLNATSQSDIVTM